MLNFELGSLLIFRAPSSSEDDPFSTGVGISRSVSVQVYSVRCIFGVVRLVSFGHMQGGLGDVLWTFRGLFYERMYISVMVFNCSEAVSVYGLVF